MYSSLIVYGKIAATLFQMVYETLILKGKRAPFFACTTIFDTILEAENQNNEFDMPDQNHGSIKFNRNVRLSVCNRTYNFHALLSVCATFGLYLGL